MASIVLDSVCVGGRDYVGHVLWGDGDIAVVLLDTHIYNNVRSVQPLREALCAGGGDVPIADGDTRRGRMVVADRSIDGRCVRHIDLGDPELSVQKEQGRERGEGKQDRRLRRQNKTRHINTIRGGCTPIGLQPPNSELLW